MLVGQCKYWGWQLHIVKTSKSVGVEDIFISEDGTYSMLSLIFWSERDIAFSESYVIVEYSDL